MQQERPKKNYVLFGLAIALLLLGGTAIYLGQQAVGALAVLASVGFVRMSKVHPSDQQPGELLRDGANPVSQQRAHWPYTAWALGVVVLLSGLVVLRAGSYVAVCSAGVVAIMASAVLIRIVGHGLETPFTGLLGEKRRPGWQPWAIAAAALIGSVASWHAMVISQQRGGNDVWPVYAFAAAALVLAVAMGALVVGWQR